MLGSTTHPALPGTAVPRPFSTPTATVQPSPLRGRTPRAAGPSLFPKKRFSVRTPLRRTIALTGLTAAVVVSGSIAAADGTAVQDITDAALASAPVATDLSTAIGEDAVDVGPGLDSATIAELRAAADTEPAVAPRTRTAPARGDRTAAEPGYLGRASWYGPGFHGNLTANGEVYDQWAMTAAHKTLPFGTQLRVTNVANGRSVVVRINDRGPFIPGREIDLSRAAADALGFAGVATVRIEQL